jgi:hypothetical protein
MGLRSVADTPVGMRGLVIVSRDDQRVPHDGSAGCRRSADCLAGCGWGVDQGVPDRVGGPGRVVTTDSRELRRRLLQARLVV